MLESFNRAELGVISTNVNLADVERTIEKLNKNRQDEADLFMMVEGLKELEKWCTAADKENLDKTKAFYGFFESAIVGSFYRYRKSKTATWSLKKNWLKVLGIALLPVVSAMSTPFVEEVVAALLEKSEEMAIGKAVPVMFVLLTAFGLIQMYLEWAKNKNDKETWVRHSTCYSRLNLALSKFVLSEKTGEDYEHLVQTTYAILEQNLDQFALNMSSQGMAERPNIFACEDDDD